MIGPMRGAVAALVVLASPLVAQDRLGPVVLRLPASPWALALGDAGAAIRSTSDVVFYNPSSITLATGAAVSVQRWGGASTAANLSHTVISNGWGIGVGVRYLDYGAMDDGITHPALLHTRGPLLGSSLAASFGLAREYKRLRIGVAAKYVEERLPGDRDGFLAIDAGLGRDVGRLGFGLSVRDIGPRRLLGATPYKPPMRVALGATYRPRPIGVFFDAGATAEVTVDREGEVGVAGGGELIWVPLDGWAIALRAGFRTTDRVGDLGNRPYTGGVGVSLDRFSLDYAIDPQRGGAVAHRIGLRMR
jgi:hypothetical protein